MESIRKSLEEINKEVKIMKVNEEVIERIATKFTLLEEGEKNFIAGYIVGMEYAKEKKEELAKAAG